MNGTWRDGFALVIEALAARGLALVDFDDCEIWEVAAALGANAYGEDGPQSGSTWNQRRAEALARGEPEPQWGDEPPTAAELAQLELLMSTAPGGDRGA